LAIYSITSRTKRPLSPVSQIRAGNDLQKFQNFEVWKKNGKVLQYVTIQKIDKTDE